MKTNIYFFATVLLVLIPLNSCNSNGSRKNDPGLIFSVENLQYAVTDAYANGQVSWYTLKEITEDRTSPDLSGKVTKLFSSVTKIDQNCIQIFSFLEDVKSDLMISLGENLKYKMKGSILSRSYSDNEPLYPSIYNLKNVKYSGRTDFISLNGTLGKEIVKQMNNFRKSLCELIASSVIVESGTKPYFFKDPNITDFKDWESLDEQLELAIEKSNVAQDDKEAIKKIYALLSHSEENWNSILSDDTHWISAFGVLLSLQHEILKARSDALSLIRSRITGCGDYGFTNIVPFVFGKEVARKGEDVFLEVGIFAYNRDKQPFVEVYGNAEILEIKDGKAFLKVNVGNANEVTIKGNITIKNKSGIPKTEEWSKTIVVLPESLGKSKDYVMKKR